MGSYSQWEQTQQRIGETASFTHQLCNNETLICETGF
jgi:hypothetical protein